MSSSYGSIFLDYPWKRLIHSNLPMYCKICNLEIKAGDIFKTDINLDIKVGDILKIDDFGHYHKECVNLLDKTSKDVNRGN